MFRRGNPDGVKPGQVVTELEKIMCSRCGTFTRIACKSPERSESQQLEQMCICIHTVLEPVDGNYPTGVGY
jgi:hypothetical protein